MRFAGRLNRTEFVDLVDRRHDEIRASAEQFVLYGLADWSGPRMIGSWGWTDGVLTEAGLAYGVPNGPGPWMEIVTTAGPAADWVTNRRFSAAAGTDPSGEGDPLVRVEEATRSARTDEIVLDVDGVARKFRSWPAQPIGSDRRAGWYAALDGIPGLAIEACGVAPAEVRLVTVTDVAPYLAASREVLLARYDAAQPPPGQA